MTREHDVFREWIGAYVLGALEPAERAEFERHLRDCDVCDAELGRLAAIPPLLRTIDPPEPLDPTSVDRVVNSARRQVAGVSRSQQRSLRRWRAATAAVGVAAGILAFMALRPDAVDEPPERVSISVEGSITGAIQLERRGWGTVIDLELSDLPRRDSYLLWTVDAQGEFRSGGSWGPTPSGRAIVQAASSAQLEDIVRVVVTSGDPADVVLDSST